MKRLNVLLTALIVSVAAACGTAAFSTGRVTAHAENRPTETMAALDISNGEFKNKSGSSVPATPSDWTGAFGSSETNGKSYYGVVDTAKFDAEAWGIEGADIGVLEKGALHQDKLPNEQKTTEALLLNNGNYETVYSYSSQEITIPANSYFELTFSAFTKKFEPTSART